MACRRLTAAGCGAGTARSLASLRTGASVFDGHKREGAGAARNAASHHCHVRLHAGPSPAGQHLPPLSAWSRSPRGATTGRAVRPGGGTSRTATKNLATTRLCVGTRRSIPRGATLIAARSRYFRLRGGLSIRPLRRAGPHLAYLSRPSRAATTFFRQPLGSAFARRSSPGLPLSPGRCRGFAAYWSSASRAICGCYWYAQSSSTKSAPTSRARKSRSIVISVPPSRRGHPHPEVLRA